jgi:hypothetical protein
MTGLLFWDWASSFLWTLGLEIPLYVLLLRGPLGLWRAALLALGVNLLTHPALWFLMPQFHPWWLWLLVGELGVFAVEALLLAWALRLRGDAQRAVFLPIVASACANSVSAVMGLIF